MEYTKPTGERVKYILLFLLSSATNAFRHGQISVLAANSKKQDQPDNNPSYLSLVILPSYHLSSYGLAYLDPTVQ